MIKNDYYDLADQLIHRRLRGSSPPPLEINPDGFHHAAAFIQHAQHRQHPFNW